MRLSVLIPAYNPPGDYLQNIIRTLSEQANRHDGVEIVVVDDGSEPNLEWTKQFPLVRYFRKENGGEGSVRNRLIAEASGEYIQFVDADDIISDTALDIIFEHLDKGYDFISYNWLADGNSGCQWQRKGTPYLNYAVWAYTFKKSFVDGYRFREDMPVGCDTEWLDRLPKSENHIHDARHFIYYRFIGNEGSLCHRNMRGEFNK